MADPIPEAITNFQILGLARQAYDFIDESQKCISAKSNNFTGHDIERMKKEVSHFRKYHLVYAELPILDLPHYAPNPLPVPKRPERVNCKNGRMMTWCDYWYSLTEELLKCDSNSLPNGYHPHDCGRVEPPLSQMERFIAAVESDPQIDLPDQQQDVSTDDQPS